MQVEMTPVAINKVYSEPVTLKTESQASQSTAPAVVRPNSGRYRGYDHVHWYVGNAKQAGTSDDVPPDIILTDHVS